MRIIIHAGQQKTASSSIQSQLSRLRPQLKQRGILYSLAFGTNKARDLGDGLRGRSKTGKNYEQCFNDFAAELAGDWSAIILSQENLYRLKPHHISELHKIVTQRGGLAQVYTYIRRPDEHLSSFYQQKVQGFKDRTIDQFIDDCIENDYYSFAKKFAQWSAVFGKVSIYSRLFHRETITKPPVEDFLDWAKIDTRGIVFPAEEEANANAGLDPVLIEVARGITRYFFEFPDRLSGEFVFAFRRSYRDFNSGSKLAVSQQQAARLCAAVRDECEAFADAFLSPDEKRLLLAEPRPTSASDVPALEDVIERALLLLNSLPERIPGAPADQPALVLEDQAVAAALRDALQQAKAAVAELPIANMVAAAIDMLRDVPSPGDATEPDSTTVLFLLWDLCIALGYDVGRSALSTVNPATLAQRDKKLHKKRRGNAKLLGRGA